MSGADPDRTQARETVERKLEIQNKLGLHARPAALFVKTAARYASNITVEKDGVEVSGKSIMGLLTIEGHQGSVLKVTAEGQDAGDAVEALSELFESKFNEE